MIKVDIVSAIAIFITFSICLVFVRWIFYSYKSDIEDVDLRHLESCSHCGYIFFYFGKSDIITCPQCKYYFDSSDSETMNTKRGPDE